MQAGSPQKEKREKAGGTCEKARLRPLCPRGENLALTTVQPGFRINSGYFGFVVDFDGKLSELLSFSTFQAGEVARLYFISEEV